MAKSRFEYVKKFEEEPKCLQNCWIVVRIDGKGFHKFTDQHGFKKPNDVGGLTLMTRSAASVMYEFRDVVLAFGHSDEYSFIFRKNCDIFNRRKDKIVTLAGSIFSSSYVFFWHDYFPDTALKYPPAFDARLVIYPTDENLRDYMSWRQTDVHVNNLYNTCFWALVLKGGKSPTEAEERLRGTVSSQKNELLFEEFQINYNDEPETFRKGTTLLRKFMNFPEGTQKTVVVSYHCDIIKDEFWEAHLEILQCKKKELPTIQLRDDLEYFESGIHTSIKTNKHEKRNETHAHKDKKRARKIKHPQKKPTVKSAQTQMVVPENNASDSEELENNQVTEAIKVLSPERKNTKETNAIEKERKKQTPIESAEKETQTAILDLNQSENGEPSKYENNINSNKGHRSSLKTENQKKESLKRVSILEAQPEEEQSETARSDVNPVLAHGESTVSAILSARSSQEGQGTKVSISIQPTEASKIEYQEPGGPKMSTSSQIPRESKLSTSQTQSDRKSKSQNKLTGVPKMSTTSEMSEDRVPRGSKMSTSSQMPKESKLSASQTQSGRKSRDKSPEVPKMNTTAETLGEPKTITSQTSGPRNSSDKFPEVPKMSTTSEMSEDRVPRGSKMSTSSQMPKESKLSASQTQSGRKSRDKSPEVPKMNTTAETPEEPKMITTSEIPGNQDPENKL